MNKKSIFATDEGKNLSVTFFLVTTLFFLWGFCNGMIDVMDKHFQEELHLTLAQSANVQWAHYLGYFLMAMPAGWLAGKLGYKYGIITGLLMVAAGGLWFIPATHIAAFWAFLVGVCFIAAGLTFLETIANPYTTVLGSAQYAATRINLAQSCNGVGWIFGPIVGSLFFYSKNAEGVSTGSQTLYIPYVGVAIAVIALAVIFYFASVPEIKAKDDYHFDDSQPGIARSIWSHPHFVMAVGAQFLYVAAQAGIFSFFINYMTAEVPSIPASWHGFLHAGWLEPGKDGALHISNAFASILASAGFICFLMGRFTGAALLKNIAAHKMLGIYAMLNTGTCFVVFCKLGWLSVACVFLSYFFMSIMFPTIFALGIFGLGGRAKQASSFIVMAIMGGATLPKLMGHIADNYGMSRSFIVPMVCFAFIAIYGFSWSKLSKSQDACDIPARVH